MILKYLKVIFVSILALSILVGCADQPEQEIRISETFNPYLENSYLWVNWQNMGVSNNTPLAVDFSFISPSKSSANDFLRYLKQQGYKSSCHEYTDYEQNHPGTKMWDVELTTAEQTWTLEKLNQQARDFNQIAIKYNCVLDGIGAMMP
jgi:hypothetical protein